MDMSEKLNGLEQKILDERSRVSADRLDISFGEIMNMYVNEELIIRPEYQRLFRWNVRQKSALIESVLLGIPIPPIFVAEDKNGVWEIVDGLQRISTILSFFGKLKKELLIIPSNDEIAEDDDGDIVINKNKWKLEGCSLVEELDGFDIDTLPTKYVLNIKRSSCRVEILRGSSSTTMKYELFKRLNSCGSHLTAQEIRNAIYRSVNDKVNKLVEDLSQNIVFKELTNLSIQKRKELYDQELILRFMAFSAPDNVIDGNTASVLDKFMQEATSSNDFPVEEYKTLFNRTIELICKLEDKSVFRNSTNYFVPAYFEAIMICVAQNIDYYELNRDILKTKITELKCNDNFKRYMGSASNSKNRIRKRLQTASEIFKVC